MKFEDYRIAPEIKRNLEALDFKRPTDIQYKASKNQRLQVELSLMQLSSINSIGLDAEKKNDLIKKSSAT